jgi:hypothetical protein
MENAIRLANCLKIHQTNTWRFILSEGAVSQLTPMEKHVLRAILQLEPEIEGGMLPTARITEIVNLDMPKGFRFSSTKVGKIIAGLGFKNQKLPHGRSRGIAVDPATLKKYKSLLIQESNVSKVSNSLN